MKTAGSVGPSLLKRSFCLVISVVLAMGFLPSTAYATGSEAASGGVSDEQAEAALEGARDAQAEDASDAQGLAAGAQASLAAGARKLAETEVVKQVKVYEAGGAAAALTESGRVYTWGDNRMGALGLGYASDPFETDDWWFSEPQCILEDVRQLCENSNVGTESGMGAITNDGSLYIWGHLNAGGFGTGNEEPLYAPTKMLDDIAQAWVGTEFSYAITSDGTLYATTYDVIEGNERLGCLFEEIGDGFVSAALDEGGVGFGIKADGALYEWTEEPGEDEWMEGVEPGPTPSPAPQGPTIDDPRKVMDNVAQVWAGSGTVAALRTNGTLWMWGDNGSGEIPGVNPYETTYVDFEDRVKVLDDIFLFSGDGTVFAAVANDGTLFTWGAGGPALANGQNITGDGGVNAVREPVAVQSNVRNFQTDGSASVFMKSNGTFWICGATSLAEDGYIMDNLVLEPKPLFETDEVITIEGGTQNTEEWTFGNEIDFTVPNNIPVFGGGNVNLNLGNVPVQIEREGNTFRVGVGVSDLKELIDSGGWQTFKKFVETQKTSIATGISGLDLAKTYDTWVTQGFKVSPEISVWGYAEGTMTSSHIASAGGKVSISMKAKGSQEWQTVFVVPIVVTFSSELGFEETASLGIDLNQKEVYLDGDVELTLPKAKLTGGVGVAWVADIGAYGSAANKVKFSMKPRGVDAWLEGELGIRVRLLFVEYEKALLEGKWAYLGTAPTSRALSLGASNGLDGSSFKIERVASSAWNGAQAAAVRSRDGSAIGSGQLSVLQSSVYAGADPRLVQTASGTNVLVFAQDVESRSTGNHTAVAYSVYDDASGAWSEPRIVDDDGTADFDPSVAVSGDEVWIAWGNASRQFDEAEVASPDFLSELARSCDIEAASLSFGSDAGRSGEASIETMRITQDDVYDSNASIAVVDGVAQVAWLANEGNDPLALSGSNSVMLASAEEGAQARCVYACDAPVGEVSAGELEGQTAVAFLRGSSDSAGSAGDAMLMVKQGDAEPAEVEAGALNLSFANLGGQPSLLWYAQGEEGGSLHSLQGAGGRIVALIEESDTFTSDFSVTDGEQGQLILCAAEKDVDVDSADAAQEGTDIQAYLYENGTVSEPVRLTDAAGYASCATGVASDGGWTLALLRSDVEVDAEADSVDQDVDLCTLGVEPGADVRIEQIDPHDETFGEFGSTVSVTLVNEGLRTCSGVQASIKGDAVQGSAEAGDLAPGQSVTVEVPVVFDASLLQPQGAYELTVTTSEGAATTRSFVAGRPNLSLEGEYVGGQVSATLANAGSFDCKASIEVRDGDASGELLYSEDRGTVSSVSQPYYWSLGEEKVREFKAKGVESLYVCVVADQEESFNDDNFFYAYIGDDVLGTLDHLKVELPSTEFDVNGGFDPARDMKVKAVYADGSESELDPGAYTTNAAELDLTTAGEKTLVVSFAEGGIGRSVEVPLTMTGELAVPTFTLSFDSQGGSDVAAQEVAKGSSPVRPSDPEREGYVFVGWFADAACTQPFDFSAALASDATAYAGWKQDEGPVDPDPDPSEPGGDEPDDPDKPGGDEPDNPGGPDEGDPDDPDGPGDPDPDPDNPAPDNPGGDPGDPDPDDPDDPGDGGGSDEEGSGGDESDDPGDPGDGGQDGPSSGQPGGLENPDGNGQGDVAHDGDGQGDADQGGSRDQAKDRIAGTGDVHAGVTAAVAAAALLAGILMLAALRGMRRG